MNLIKDQKGYLLTFWMIFFGFIFLPILALSIELGLYYYARAQIVNAADAAALAAAEISQRVFEETGDLQTTSKTWANAQDFASLNNGYLAEHGVYAIVTGISVDAGNDTVLVQVSANLDRLFPSVVPDVVVTESGSAENPIIYPLKCWHFAVKKYRYEHLRDKRAHTLALAEMYTQGVSTRQVAVIVEKKCQASAASSLVSKAAKQMDEILEALRTDPWVNSSVFTWMLAMNKCVR